MLFCLIQDDSKQGADLTRSVVKNYVRNNPNDLYILVKKASDDPANWPWSLREFILTAPPKGLGLTPRQTIVVGTRARDFLINEKNDVRSQADLLERVRKRAVRDPTGRCLNRIAVGRFCGGLSVSSWIFFFFCNIYRCPIVCFCDAQNYFQGRRYLCIC